MTDDPPTPGGAAWRDRIERAVADARAAHDEDDSAALRSVSELIAAYQAHETLLTQRAEQVEAALHAQSQTNAALIVRVDALRSLVQTAIAWLEAINPGISGQFVTELERIEGGDDRRDK